MEPEIPIEPKEEVKLPKMSIELQENGSVLVIGPLFDKILCYGMLQSAKDILQDHHKKMAPPKIQPPHRIMDFLRNGKKD